VAFGPGPRDSLDDFLQIQNGLLDFAGEGEGRRVGVEDSQLHSCNPDSRNKFRTPDIPLHSFGFLGVGRS
jgi:hypothetical protein